MTDPDDAPIGLPAPDPAPVNRWTNVSPRLRMLDWGGSGTPLLLLHGMAGNAHWWDLSAPLLRSLYHPVALDFRGHGESEWVSNGTYRLEDSVADIGLAAEALGWKRFVLAGHSLGARLAASWAADYPDRLLGLILVDFLPEFRRETMAKYERARRLPRPFYPDLESAITRFRLEPRGTILPDPEMRRLAKASIRPYKDGYTWKFDWSAIQHGYPPVWPLLPKLTMPVLQIRGGKSVVMKAEDLDRIASGLRNVMSLTVPEALHHVQLDAPSTVADAMNQFLRDRLLSQLKR